MTDDSERRYRLTKPLAIGVMVWASCAVGLLILVSLIMIQHFGGGGGNTGTVIVFSGLGSVFVVTAVIRAFQLGRHYKDD